MQPINLVTAAEAGLGGDEQVKIALQTIVENGGTARMNQIYDAVNHRLNANNCKLSSQGEASLRFYVNRVAVKAGYIYPYDKNHPGWKITPQGRDFLVDNGVESEIVVNIDTQVEEKAVPNVARGTAFELYVLKMLKAIYPYYVWYHQGKHKRNERGLDLIGDRISQANDNPKNIGVQVKFHDPKYSPTQIEWLKFLSGCFARRVESAIFITTGKLSSEQRREAGEANITVIEGKDEINRLAKLYKIPKFDLFT